MNSKPTNQVNLAAQRARLRGDDFLSPTRPGDALAVYYTLYHDPARTQLWLHETEDGRVDGVVAVCQTGFNLFQPTVVLRARSNVVAAWLLRQALRPGRPYYVVTLPSARPVLRVVIEMQREQFNFIYRFDPSRFQPELNVLVQPARSADGLPRFIIQSREQVAAEAGVNWRSRYFAEMYVQTQPWARERGWGKAVASACLTNLIQAGVQPLYTVEEGNAASLRLANTLGFVDSGSRELAGAGVRRDD
jgi:hypothetical protein